MVINFNNRQIEVNQGDLLKDVLKTEIQNSKIEDVIAARYNNSVVSLNEPINKSGTIELIGRTNKDGRYIYIRGAMFIVSMAIHELYPQANFSVNYQLSNAMYCALENIDLNERIIEEIRKRVLAIIEDNKEIRKVEMTKEEAEDFYRDNPSIRGRLQVEADKEKVTLYFCGDYFNYFYGIMPLSTGVINLIDIELFKDGFLIKYPSLDKPNELAVRGKQSLKQISAMDEYDELFKLMHINTFYLLNKRIREGKLKEIILFSEAIHERKIAQIAKKIKTQNNIKMVLIAGPSSSGKTTFAKKLSIALRVQGIKPVTLSTDNYFVERENNPVDENGNYDFECLEALDLDLLNSQLVDILKGKEVKLPTFDFMVGTKKYLGNTLKLHPDEVLIIEGIHCLNDKLTSLIPRENKFKIYISDLTVLNMDYYNRVSTTDTRLLRRIVRDYNFRGYSALHTLKMWPNVTKGEHKYIFPYQDEADVMFNSSIIYELSILKKYAMPLLEEITPIEPEYSEAKRLCSLLQYVDVVEPDWIPNNSLLREFIGGSIYEY